MSKKRLMHDLQNFVSYLEDNNIKQPIYYDENIYKFLVKFKGPKGSLYDGIKLKLVFEIPQNYPEKFPSLTFEEGLYHPSVDENTGELCLDILTSSGWSLASNLIMIFKRVIDMLMCPDTDDPVNISAHNTLKNNKKLFANLVSNK
jgi:ubiquitin-protein ligase